MLKRGSGRSPRHIVRCPREMSCSRLVSNLLQQNQVLFSTATGLAIFSDETLLSSSPGEGRAGGGVGVGVGSAAGALPGVGVTLVDGRGMVQLVSIVSSSTLVSLGSSSWTERSTCKFIKGAIWTKRRKHRTCETFVQAAFVLVTKPLRVGRREYSYKYNTFTASCTKVDISLIMLHWSSPGIKLVELGNIHRPPDCDLNRLKVA